MSAPVTVGEVIADRYRIENVLGAGGMGIVVKATHLLLQQPVAIKFLRTELTDGAAVKRLLSEAQAAAKVQSEHVVRIHDVAALTDGTPYIVMEYLEGTDLGSILAQGPLNPIDAVRYAIQTCSALGETHAAGIVHGDLKPENIYITKTTEGGKVKLLDFGISRGGAQKHLVVQDDEDAVRGTPAYMAPEQFLGGEIDGRTDLWALGAVLYEMLTGTSPFLGSDPKETIQNVVRGEPKPIERASVPHELTEVVSRCLAKKQDERPANALELTYALEQFLPHESTAVKLARATSARTAAISQRQVPTVVLPRKTARAGGWLIAIAAGLLIIAVVLVLTLKKKERTATAATAPPTTTAATAMSAVPTTAPAPSEPASASAAAAAAPSAKTSSSAPTAAKKVPAVKRATPPSPPTHTPPPTPVAPPVEEGDRFGTRK